jgi:hypothetical protein
MNKSIFIGIALMFVLASTAIAASLPSYYPTEGFRRTGWIEEVLISEGRITIGDIPYRMSDSVRVHSLSKDNASLSRLRAGTHVAFKTSQSGSIVEFWLLPKNYDATKRR